MGGNKKKKNLESRNHELKNYDSAFTLLSNSNAEMPCLKKEPQCVNTINMKPEHIGKVGEQKTCPSIIAPF